MKKLYLQEILPKIKGKILCGDLNKEIQTASIDTRTITQGDTYFGLRGENVDGSIYVKDAISKGATICIIQENPFTQEELKEYSKKATIIQVPNAEDSLVEIAKQKRKLYDGIPVIAITGSVGKTSTKDAIAGVMAQKYNVQKTQGNYNNRIGVPLTIMSLKDHDALVIEMGMNHFGEIRELTQIAKPTICVISNIGTSHIGNLGSREGILKAKLEILEGMNKQGKVIINNDNDLLHKWNIEDKTYEKITFGIHEDSDYTAKNVIMKEEGNDFQVEIEGQTYNFSTPKAGEPFVLNALSAIAVGREYKIEPEKIIKAIQETQIAKNRMDIEKQNNLLIIKDYYNSSYESIKPGLEYLAALKGGNKIAVLGDIKEVGEYAKELHEKVGKEVIKNKIDTLLTVGLDARYIAESAIENGMNIEKVYQCANNLQAIAKLKDILKPEDKILLKASNAMNFQEIYEGILRKIKVGIVCGGMSSEHDISLLSTTSILEKINKEKYDIKIIYLKKNGNVYEYTGTTEDLVKLQSQDLKLKNNIIEEVKDVDLVFPVLHGKYGEDGCIQGTLEMINKPYVGCGVFASAACLDKEYTKKLVHLAGIPVADGIVIKKQNHVYICELDDIKYQIEDICKKAEDKLGYPMFIKPSREGSSFGVNKAENKEQLVKAIKEAERYDNKLLIEEQIKGREVECAVLGNEDVISAEVGEIKSAESFYTYDAKYNNKASKTEIPADIKPEERQQIKKYAETAFKAIDGQGLARVDFFLKPNGQVILNEINTLPGFTKISMYPKLFEAANLNYTTLIDNLINLAINK